MFKFTCTSGAWIAGEGSEGAAIALIFLMWQVLHDKGKEM
jgi:hypothetical protein